MTAVDCQHKDKPQVLTPTKVIPGDGDFEVAELPRVHWPVPKGVLSCSRIFHMLKEHSDGQCMGSDCLKICDHF